MNSNTVAAIGAFISNVTGNIAGQQAQLEILKEIQSVAEQGWLSDQATIEKGITDGIAAQLPDAVAAQTATLTGQITTLKGQLAEATQDATTAKADLATEQTNHTNDNTTNETTITELTDKISSAIAALQDATQPDDTTRLANALVALGTTTNL